MAERYFQHTFENGLTLLAERMPAVQSAAVTLLLPAGAVNDPPDRSGTASVLAECVLRGAGTRDSRQLTEHLDSLGLHRSNGVGVHHTRFSCAAVADRVLEALPVYADIVRRPHLLDGGFDSARDLALQALAGVDDDPRQKVSIKLREWHWPHPYGRDAMGIREHLEKLTNAFCRTDFARRYHAQGAILAIAGAIEFDDAKRAVERAFGDWQCAATEPIRVMPPPGNYHFVLDKTEQTHIGIAYPAVDETHPDYYNLRLAVECLSGGMSGRLFTEVREKRALCYSVGASYASLKGFGSIFGYAGTSNERAQATLDCFIGEVRRLTDGVTSQELDRAKVGVKASIIMSGESTSARAGAIAHDYFIRGRIRSLDELCQAIDAITVDSVNACLKQHQPGPFTIVIVGPKELKLPN